MDLPAIVRCRRRETTKASGRRPCCSSLMTVVFCRSCCYWCWVNTDACHLEALEMRVKADKIGRSSGVVDATWRLRFVVHAAGWLHSMVLHEHVVATVLYIYPTFILSGLNQRKKFLLLYAAQKHPDMDCWRSQRQLRNIYHSLDTLTAFSYPST